MLTKIVEDFIPEQRAQFLAFIPTQFVNNFNIQYFSYYFNMYNLLINKEL